MKRLFYHSLLTALALLWLADAATAETTVAHRSPLLEVRSVSRKLFLGPGNTFVYTSEILTVYRDRWTLYHVVSSDQPTTQPFRASVVEGTLPTAFQALAQALTANNVGIQSGNCDIGSSGDYQIELTWYGRINRINTLRVGRAFAPSTCNDAVKDIFQAVHDYEVALLP